MTAALWLLLLVPLVIGIVARRRLRRVYARYRRVPNRVGAMGAQLARAMLDAQWPPADRRGGGARRPHRPL